MQIDLLKEISSSIAGQEAARVVDLLYGKKNVNEFLIAKKLDLTINQTRNILYKLADEGIVGFIRKKNKKKGGWYDHFWTLNTGKGLNKFKEILEKDIRRLNNQLRSRKLQTFYICPMCNIEFNEEEALIHDYTCPECGNSLSLKKTEADIQFLQREVEKFEKVLSEVKEEVEVVEKKEEKIKARRLRIEAEEKAKERLKKKRARERLKKKLARKKKSKKKIRKKVKKKKKKIRKKKLKKRAKKKPKKKFKKKIKRAKIKVKKSGKKKVSKKKKRV